MKKLLIMTLAAMTTLCMSISTYALAPVVILDDSYHPIHARPVIDPLITDMGEGSLGPIIEINDDSYTPIHSEPQAPLFDTNGNPTFVESRATYSICNWCSKKTLKSVSKAYYETAGCGHKVYFSGAACTQKTACGYVRIDNWIYSCNCNI